MTINKKLAIAIAAALSVGSVSVAHAQAEVFGTNASDGVDTFSFQALEGADATDVVALSDVGVTLDAEYTPQDTIAFTVSGATLDAATADDVTVTCNDANGEIGSDLTVGFLNVSGNTINFRVTVVEENSSTIGTTCVINDINVLATSLDEGDEVTATWLATTSGGLPLDRGAANTATVAEVIDQFTVEIDQELNGVIDVEQDREQFVGGPDDLVFTLSDFADDVDASIGPADLTDSTFTVNGNFSYLIAEGADDDICELDDLVGNVSINNGGSIASIEEDCSAITFNAIADSDSTTVTFSAPGGVVLPVQQFSGNSDFTYENGFLTGDEVDAHVLANIGEWTLNGASVFINYMPYGPNISQIIYAANKGPQTGEITVDAFNGNGDSCTFTAGTLAANSTAQLSGAILAGVQGCAGFLTNGAGRVAMTVTINVPADDVELYSAYNVGGSDRGTVVNDSNGRKVIFD